MVLSCDRPRRKIDPRVPAKDYQKVVLQWLKKRGSMDLNVELKGLEKMVCCKGRADWESMGKWHELFGGLFAASRTGRIDPTMLEVSLQQLDLKEKINFTSQPTHKVAENVTTVVLSGCQKYRELHDSDANKRRVFKKLDTKSRSSIDMVLQTIGDRPQPGMDIGAQESPGKKMKVSDEGVGKLQPWEASFFVDSPPTLFSKVRQDMDEDCSGNEDDFLCSILEFDATVEFDEEPAKLAINRSSSFPDSSNLLLEVSPQSIRSESTEHAEVVDHSPTSVAMYRQISNSLAVPDSQQSCIDGTTLPDIYDCDKDRPGIQTPKTPPAKQSALPQCLQDIAGRMKEAAAAVGKCTSIVPAAVVGGKRDDQKRCVVQSRQKKGEPIRGKNGRLAQNDKVVPATPPPTQDKTKKKKVVKATHTPKKTRAKAPPTPKKQKQQPGVKVELVDGGDGGDKPKAAGKSSIKPHCRKSQAWHRTFAKAMLASKGKSVAQAYKAAKAAYTKEFNMIKAAKEKK